MYYKDRGVGNKSGNKSSHELQPLARQLLFFSYSVSECLSLHCENEVGRSKIAEKLNKKKLKIATADKFERI